MQHKWAEEAENQLRLKLEHSFDALIEVLERYVSVATNFSAVLAN